MVRTNQFYMCIVLLASFLYRTNAQVCTESGWYAGVDASNEGDGYAPDTGLTYILHDYGVITCEGVIADWAFHKTLSCDNIKLQVWRPENATHFRLIGENLYDNVAENCDPRRTEVTVYIPAHEQIPVKPGDILGWTHLSPSSTSRTMIRYNVTTAVTTKNYGICDSGDPGEVFPDLSCTNRIDVDKMFRLQAHVIQGTAPHIANLPYTVEIREGEPVDFLVYEVQASHEKNNIEGDIAWGNPSPVVLTYTEYTLPLDGAFTVTKRPVLPLYTGLIETAVILDYEYLQQHQVVVTVNGQGLETSSVLTVNVIDVNEEHRIDNLPKTIDVSVKGVSVGEQIYQVLVSDPDTINPSVIEYFITSTDIKDPAPPFLIDQYTGIVCISEDVTHWFEPTTYTLDITTTDYMHDVTGILTVHLIDTKTIPVITNLNANIPLPEDAPDLSEIFQVLVNGTPEDTFLYEIRAVDPVQMTSKFGIHQDGWIFLTNQGDFDYIKYPDINIRVRVYDGDLESAEKSLTINLKWVNEAPIFQPKIYRVTIPERCGKLSDPGGNCGNSLPWEVPDLEIIWTHRDAPPANDPVNCRILASHGSDKFRMNNACSKLEVIDVIDVNTDPTLMSINLTLTIQDTGPPVLGDTAKVFISVYDINDNNPVFDQQVYTDDIDENTPGGVSLFTVAATDKDFGRNGEIYYSITDPDGYYFQVDPFTGVVSTKHPVEYDGSAGIKTFTFPIIATDRGLSPDERSATASVTITVNDVNDNKPEFNCTFAHAYPMGVNPYDPDYQCFYNLDVRYDILINYNLISFHATDIDDITREPVYSILNVEPHFRMDNQNGNGLLFTVEKLYKYHMYGIIVEADDEGTPSLRARPPSVVRVDTFDGPEHLVDITLGNTSIPFNKTLIQTDFIQILREYCSPWLVRLYAFSEQRDRTIVTVYAIEDNSTFLHSNFDQEKHFVSLSDLLQKLRSSLQGTPRPEFEDIASDYIPLEVQPTYPKFLIHTLGGWITLGFLFLLLLILIIVFTVCLCRCFSVCCFRKHLPTKHAWMHDKPTYEEDYYDTVKHSGTVTGTVTGTGTGTGTGTAVKRRTTGQSTKPPTDAGGGKTEGSSGQDSTGRRPSVDTVHSLIYDTKK